MEHLTLTWLSMSSCPIGNAAQFGAVVFFNFLLLLKSLQNREFCAICTEFSAELSLMFRLFTGQVSSCCLFPVGSCGVFKKLTQMSRYYPLSRVCLLSKIRVFRLFASKFPSVWRGMSPFDWPNGKSLLVLVSEL